MGRQSWTRRRVISTNRASLKLSSAGRSSHLNGRRRSQSMRRAPVLLELKDLASPDKLEPISLKVRAGEVVGIAGLLGSGRSELLHAIFGADPDATGDVRVEGRLHSAVDCCGRKGGPGSRSGRPYGARSRARVRNLAQHDASRSRWRFATEVGCRTGREREREAQRRFDACRSRRIRRTFS